ncbi:MAG: ferredoxin family protein [Gemmataceae bacterium]
MSGGRVTVVVSQAQGKDPARRRLEEELVAGLLGEPGVDVGIVPHIYDLDPSHPGYMYLTGLAGDVIVCAWLYPRATYWLLQRMGVRGKKALWPEEMAPSAEEAEAEEVVAQAGVPAPDAQPVPDRWIYCLDLRSVDGASACLEQVRRALDDCRRRLRTDSLVQIGIKSRDDRTGPAATTFDQPTGRRWYPVIDYERCTNCLECLDFCLFGVYGVDAQQVIAVVQQDNCRRGCPACSRVCPEHAIIFPEYKTPAIAGAPVGEVDGLKIDLTRLFGGDDALTIAAQERDAELVKDGRAPVGLTVGVRRRTQSEPRPKDDLDALMDQLDALEL